MTEKEQVYPLPAVISTRQAGISRLLQGNSPKVRADPFAILWLPWIGAVIWDLFDSSFVHWDGKRTAETTVREMALNGSVFSENTHGSWHVGKRTDKHTT